MNLSIEVKNLTKYFRIASKRGKILKKVLDDVTFTVNKGEFVGVLGLDIFTIEELKRLIKQLNKAYGTTILISSHRLNLLEGICDKIFIIINGKIVIKTTISEIKKIMNSFKVIEIEILGLHTNVKKPISKLDNLMNIYTLYSNYPQLKTILKIITTEDMLISDIVDVISKNLRIKGKGHCLIKSIKVRKPTLEDYLLHITHGR